MLLYFFLSVNKNYNKSLLFLFFKKDFSDEKTVKIILARAPR